MVRLGARRQLLSAVTLLVVVVVVAVPVSVMINGASMKAWR
jgi:hypothetical protein